jgi:hypothetical protein
MTEPTFHTDLVNALGALTEVPKAGKVNAGQRRYSYMTLPDLLAHVRGTLAGHRLAVVQLLSTAETGHQQLETVLLHTSGERMSSGLLSFDGGANPQTVGSAVTYFKRYQLAALVGLAGDDDDDGQAAARAAQQHRDEYAQTRPVQRVQQHATDPDPWAVHPITPHEQPERADGPASEGQIKYMFDLMGKAGIPRDMYKRWLAGVVGWDGPVEDFTSKTLTKHQVSGIITRLQKLVPPPEEGP